MPRPIPYRRDRQAMLEDCSLFDRIASAVPRMKVHVPQRNSIRLALGGVLPAGLRTRLCAWPEAHECADEGQLTADIHFQPFELNPSIGG
jgi:hypothetical protein